MFDERFLKAGIVGMAAVYALGCSAIIEGKLSDKGRGPDGGSDTGDAGGASGEDGRGGEGGEGGSAGIGATCEPDTCSGHGQCDDAGGQAVCSCDSEYAGLRCDECADGYQDNDGDGECIESCARAELSCGSNQACDDSGGRPGCVCNEGYQDRDGDGDCSPDCAHANISCGKNQYCDDASGTAECFCDEGHQDNDGDGDCSPDCENAGLSCGTNEHCEDTDGTARCRCDEGYAGTECGQCDTGYQDNDNDGTCLPDCATAALDCSGHGTCDDSGGTAGCDCELRFTGTNCEQCVVGYALDDTDACQWQGVVQDPGFDDAAAWEMTGSAAIDPAGWAEFPQNAYCFGGTVSQTVPVPAYETADPLWLKFNARMGSTAAGQPAPAVTIDGVMYRVRIKSSTEWVTNTFCLGESAYGTDVEIVLTRFDVPASCNFDPFHIDDLVIEPAPSGACPAPGDGVLNGDFSQDGVGWPDLTDGNSGPYVTVAGGTMTMTSTRCGADPTTTGRMWVPAVDDAPNLALEIVYSGAGPADDLELTVSLNGSRVAVLPATGGSEASRRFCLPPWPRGSTADLGLTAYLTSGGPCADILSATVTSIALVTEPACEHGPGPIGGGFENALVSALYSSWKQTTFVNGSPPPSPTLEMVNDPSLAHSGDVVLHLGVERTYSYAMVSQYIQVPHPDATGGPAVSYWYRASAADDRADFGVCPGSTDNCDILPTTANIWTQGTTCLDPALAGHTVELFLRAYGTSGATWDFSLEDVWFDDVAVTTDAGCPSS